MVVAQGVRNRAAKIAVKTLNEKAAKQAADEITASGFAVTSQEVNDMYQELQRMEFMWGKFAFVYLAQMTALVIGDKPVITMWGEHDHGGIWEANWNACSLSVMVNNFHTYFTEGAGPTPGLPWDIYDLFFLRNFSADISYEILFGEKHCIFVDHDTVLPRNTENLSYLRSATMLRGKEEEGKVGICTHTSVVPPQGTRYSFVGGKNHTRHLTQNPLWGELSARYVPITVESGIGEGAAEVAFVCFNPNMDAPDSLKNYTLHRQ